MVRDILCWLHSLLQRVLCFEEMGILMEIGVLWEFVFVKVFE